MPRRKSLDQLREQARRLRSEANRRGQNARAERVVSAYERYRDNIRGTRTFQRDLNQFQNVSREARRAEMEDINWANALHNLATRIYNRANTTSVSQRTYMGLNNG